MSDDEKQLLEKQRRKAVKTALVLAFVALAFYVGYIVMRL